MNLIDNLNIHIIDLVYVPLASVESIENVLRNTIEYTDIFMNREHDIDNENINNYNKLCCYDDILRYLKEHNFNGFLATFNKPIMKNVVMLENTRFSCTIDGTKDTLIYGETIDDIESRINYIINIEFNSLDMRRKTDIDFINTHGICEMINY